MKKIEQIITRTGEVVRGKRLADALASVAEMWTADAYAIRSEDKYASHVSEQEKDAELYRNLEEAERVRNGVEPMTTHLKQSIETALTDN